MAWCCSADAGGEVGDRSRHRFARRGDEEVVGNEVLVELRRRLSPHHTCAHPAGGQSHHGAQRIEKRTGSLFGPLDERRCISRGSPASSM